MTRSFPLDQIRRAAQQAVDEGKALVTVGESGVIALIYYPRSRLTPIVVGDGGDLLATEDGEPSKE